MCARRETPNYDLLSYQRWTGEVLANRGCHEFICDDNNIGRLCVFVFSLYTRARPRSRLPPLQIFWRRWNFLRPRGHVYVHTFFFSRFQCAWKSDLEWKYLVAIRVRRIPVILYAPHRRRALINPQNVFRTTRTCVHNASIFCSAALQ